MSNAVEQPRQLSRAASVWAMLQLEAGNADQRIKENPHETARGSLADPEFWRRLENVARRASIPTADPVHKLWWAHQFAEHGEKDLLVFGDADPVVFAFYERVRELRANLELSVEDLAAETRRMVDFLELQPEVL